MINKRIYVFLFIALLSYVSLSMSQSAGFVESTLDNAVECVEQKNNIESEFKEVSYLSFDLSIDIFEVQSYITYKDEIYTIQISNNLLRPPIFT